MVFTVTGQTSGEQFWRRYRFFLDCKYGTSNLISWSPSTSDSNVELDLALPLARIFEIF
jgi:hypothetical protein